MSGLMRLGVGLLGLMLAGCASAPQTAAIRTAGAPIYSNASFDLARLRGDWRQVATVAASNEGCEAGRASFVDGAQGLTGQAHICVGGRMRDWSGPVRGVGPGRFTLGGEEPWWVLWDDVDNRTLVIGTPSGAFGFVLDRKGDIPPDRVAAAREIFDFNGYDLAQFRR